MLLRDEVRELLVAQAVPEIARGQAKQTRCCRRPSGRRPTKPEHRPELAEIAPRPVADEELLAASRQQAQAPGQSLRVVALLRTAPKAGASGVRSAKRERAAPPPAPALSVYPCRQPEGAPARSPGRSG